jgi:hypothetical protein
MAFRMSSIAMPGYDIDESSDYEGHAVSRTRRDLGVKSGRPARNQKRRFTASTTGSQRKRLVRGLAKIPS